MGLFTDVVPAKSILPEPYRNLSDWQTKDVVRPQMETLEITEDGRLIYIWHEWKVCQDEDSPLDYRFESEKEHRTVLDFHGDMCFYTLDEDLNFIELVARFTEGKLQKIRVNPELDE